MKNTADNELVYQLNYAKWLIDAYDFEDKELAILILNKTISDFLYREPPWWKRPFFRYKKWDRQDLYKSRGNNPSNFLEQVYWACANYYSPGYILSIETYYNRASKEHKIRFDILYNLFFMESLSITPYVKVPSYLNFFSSM